MFKLTKSTFIFTFFAAILSVFVSIRIDTPDTQTYRNVLNTIFVLEDPISFYKLYRFEWGFNFLGILQNNLFGTDVLTFLLVAGLQFFFIFKTQNLISKEVGKDYLLLCLGIYFCWFFWSFQFTIIRQAIALPIAFYASLLFFYGFISRGFIFFLLAISFHLTSLVVFFVFIAFYFFRPKMKKVRLFHFIFVFAFTVLVCRLFMSSSLFSGLANLTDPLRDAEHGAMRGVFNLRNVRDYLLIFIFIGFFKEEFLTSKVHTLFTYFFIISVALRVGFYDFSILAARLPTVFSFTEIFLLPLVLGKITPQSTRVVFLTLWMFFNLSIFFTIVYPIEQFISDYLG